MSAPQIGKTYAVDHSRKGKFQMRVTDIRNEWVDGVVTAGKAGAMLRYNEVPAGEEITIRAEFAKFTEVTP